MPSYRLLDSDQLIQTTEKLRLRITERFPDSGLSRVAGELARISRETAQRAVKIQRPYVPLRFAIALLTMVTIALAIGIIRLIDPRTFGEHIEDAFDFAQFSEATLGSIVFLGAGFIFLFTLEKRMKRGRSLEAIYELRSLAHVVDMHQLTKDPERVVRGGESTASSPERKMTAFELGRYLDYCSELLSLISKIAVLYVQGVKDDDVLDAVDQIESLTTGLSRKIWQKITLLDRMKAREGTADKSTAATD